MVAGSLPGHRRDNLELEIASGEPLLYPAVSHRDPRHGAIRS